MQHQVSLLDDLAQIRQELLSVKSNVLTQVK